MTASTFEQVRNVASDIFAVPADKITTESSPETIDNWDSMQHLNLVLAIEEKFGVQLEPEDIEQMTTVGAIAKLLPYVAGVVGCANVIVCDVWPIVKTAVLLVMV